MPGRRPRPGRRRPLEREAQTRQQENLLAKNFLQRLRETPDPVEQVRMLAESLRQLNDAHPDRTTEFLAACRATGGEQFMRVYMAHLGNLKRRQAP